jgi:hypothetical protein
LILLHQGGREIDLLAGVVAEGWEVPGATGAELFIGPRMPTLVVTPVEMEVGYCDDDAGLTVFLDLHGWRLRVIPWEVEA